MNTAVFNIDQLESHLNAREWDKAKSLLNEYLRSEISDDEKGAIYVAFVTTYLSVMNRINAEYEAALDDAISTIQAVNKKEKEINDQIDLARVKNEIKQMHS
jgi:hypothetical protein